MKLLIEVKDEAGGHCFSQVMEVPDEVPFAPGSDVLTLAGVKTAIDYALFEEKRGAPCA